MRPAAAAAAAPAAGATLPFTSYAADTGMLGGGATAVSPTAAPTTHHSNPALEASGHGYVHLAANGQSVQWTNNTGTPVSAVNVRLHPAGPRSRAETERCDRRVYAASRVLAL